MNVSMSSKCGKSVVNLLVSTPFSEKGFGIFANNFLIVFGQWDFVCVNTTSNSDKIMTKGVDERKPFHLEIIFL